MIVSAHQPHYLPWIGYFNKIHLSDVFMLMDNMVYTNKGYINRNRILTKNGVQYLSVPLIKPNGLNTKINELIIESDNRKIWNEKHLRAIRHNYSKGAGFKSFFPLLENSLMHKYELFCSLQKEIIISILDYLNINTEIILASETGTHGNKETELISNIIKDAGCDSILLGMGASLEYVDKDIILSKGYTVYTQKFNHPEYTQKSSSFVKGLSIIDMLLSVNRDEAIFMVKNAGSTKKWEHGK